MEEIFEYTMTSFGMDQAVSYLNDLEQVFIQLSEMPAMGKERAELKEGLRSITHQSHVVFYHPTNESVRIVRVLHARMDIPNRFEE